MSKILDQWERDFKESETVSLKRWREISIALIELVRKKDEALKFFTQFETRQCIEQGLVIGPKTKTIYDIPNVAKEALALTDQLGGSGE